MDLIRPGAPSHHEVGSVACRGRCYSSTCRRIRYLRSVQNTPGAGQSLSLYKATKFIAPGDQINTSVCSHSGIPTPAPNLDGAHYSTVAQNPPGNDAVLLKAR